MSSAAVVAVDVPMVWRARNFVNSASTEFRISSSVALSALSFTSLSLSGPRFRAAS